MCVQTCLFECFAHLQLLLHDSVVAKVADECQFTWRGRDCGVWALLLSVHHLHQAAKVLACVGERMRLQRS